MTNELLRTRRELVEVKEQLRNLQLGCTPPLNSDILETSPSTISLFVQYNGFFNELCDICQSMTINELLIKLRQITGIPDEHPIRLRVLSEDGLQTLFFLDKEPSRTVESYNDELKPRMIISIEDDDNELNSKRTCYERSRSMTSSDRTHSFESDV